ncbi:MAG TPA: hypothetical protein VFM43_08275 [Gaiellaceae bacterium]|nr:hypothetical protein [Gaiellaceae bacterium]
MKRYVLFVAAALAVALGAVGGALAGSKLAQGHEPIRPTHSTASVAVPSPAPQVADWLEVFHGDLTDPKPTHRAKPQHSAKPAHTSKPSHTARPAHGTKPSHKPAAPHHRRAKQQPHPRHPLRGTTSSIYERTAKPWVLAEQGCSAARRGESGVVVLDFGKPAFKRHGYGTILFSGRFALNHKITTAMVGYARGYVSCLPKGSTASITLARGTSNYHPDVPSAYTAGVRWARATNKLGRILRRYGWSEHVESAAADDAEPAWDPSFRRTKQFFHGFRAAVHGHTLYDYGSLDGGIGAVWSAKQAWYVAGGLRHTKALPEIYNSAMAQQWAELARIAHGRYHRDVEFAGVMTQGSASCGCGFRPSAAHRELAHALDAQGIGPEALPPSGTNIVSANY